VVSVDERGEVTMIPAEPKRNEIRHPAAATSFLLADQPSLAGLDGTVSQATRAVRTRLAATEEVTTMTRWFALVAALTVVLMSSTGAIPVRSHNELRAPQVRKIRSLSLEFVGQFQSSAPGVTPVTHIHYGYLSYIQGLSVFTHAPQDETSALFTFFADAATLRVISNGPLRVITRVGTLTIYLDRSTNGSFANPETFRDGTPVLVAAFRQEVISNTVTNSFTTFHQNAITSTRPFPANRGNVQLAVVGETFKTYFSGQGNMPGPPSGFFGGYAFSG
jgi:hypothetical protein